MLSNQKSDMWFILIHVFFQAVMTGYQEETGGFTDIILIIKNLISGKFKFELDLSILD